MIALLLVVLGVFLLGFDAADWSLGGLALLGALLIAAGAWVGGGFDRRAWFGSDAEEERWSRVDVDLDRLYSRRGFPVPNGSAFPSVVPPAGLSEDVDR